MNDNINLVITGIVNLQIIVNNVKIVYVIGSRKNGRQ